MHPALQAALIVGAWVLVVLLVSGGIWFLRRNQLIHTAVITILALLFAALVIFLRELVLMLVIAGIVAFILDRVVVRLATRMPRTTAVGITYLALVAVLGLIGGLLVPRIVHQAASAVRELPDTIERARPTIDRLNTLYGSAPDEVRNAVNATIDHIKSSAAGVAAHTEHMVLELFSWGVKSILILVMSVYLVLDRDTLHEQFLKLFPQDMRADVATASGELSDTFRSYLRGQGTVILFVAVTVAILLLVLGIPYALFIGTMAGVLEVIPYFGALAGAVPAVILGFMKSPAIGVGLIAAFIAINQIEGHVIIPLVMGKHLEMRPITILLALIAGELLGGILGMIVAVPVVSMIRVLIPYIVKQYHAFKMRERIKVIETTGSDTPSPPPEPPTTVKLVQP